MPSDRLTRQELSWLLAQEARSAAELLRKGAYGPSNEPKPAVEVTSTLDALEDAMRTLTSLHTGGAQHGRRGRIDVASLLLELVPGASVSIEPGAGTEVFGDEVEIRRMLQVLLSLGMTSVVSAETAATPVTVRRQGDTIRVAVTLGPDSSASARMEQAWLHRMAVRHGGKLELEGGLVALELPADVDNEKLEVEELRRELAAAQEQGELYARELASMFTRTDTSIPPPDSVGFAPDDAFGPLARVARSIASELRPERAAALPALADRLARFGQVDPREEATEVDVADLLRALPGPVRRSADARGVVLKLEGTGTARARKHALHAVVALLAAHAVESTPRGAPVTITVRKSDDGVTLCVEDGGPAIPIAARTKLLSLDVDAGALGRQDALSLFLADALVRRLGGSLRLEDPESRAGVRVDVFLPA